MRMKDTIMLMVVSRARKTTHESIIKIPADVDHAKILGTKNGNSFWINGIEKEISDVGMSFDIVC